MFQSASGGNGSGGGQGEGGGGGAFRNGSHHGGVSGAAHVTGHKLRRGSRGRLRDHGGGSNRRVSQQQQQQEKESARPPCTDFDVAYFHSYAHLGIHEEMIKVQFLSATNILCSCIFS